MRKGDVYVETHIVQSYGINRVKNMVEHNLVTAYTYDGKCEDTYLEHSFTANPAGTGASYEVKLSGRSIPVLLVYIKSNTNVIDVSIYEEVKLCEKVTI